MNYFPTKFKNLNEYVSLDLETTGLSARNNEIIEIGLIKVRNKRVVEKMDVLIRPENGKVPASITRITGITSKMVENAPSIEEVHYWIWDFIGNLPIIGYNVRFDLGFLKEHAPAQKTVYYLDVYPLCRNNHPNLKHCRLSDMTKRYHLHKNTHRACDDALATAQLYELSKNW